jgi:hypothetical protein
MYSFYFDMLLLSDCMSCVIVVVVVAMLPAATRLNLCAAAHMHDITTTILHDTVSSQKRAFTPISSCSQAAAPPFQQAGLFHGHWTFAAAGSDAE